MKKKLDSIIKNDKLDKGFTLIELLIVISIIGILATLLMVNFIGVRQRARDSQRKADLRQIQTMLEIYRADNGVYPTSGFPPACGTAFTSAGSTYMQKMPCDPQNTTDQYKYNISASRYDIAACLENANDSSGTSTPPSGISGCTTYYVLNNP